MQPATARRPPALRAAPPPRPAIRRPPPPAWRPAPAAPPRPSLRTVGAASSSTAAPSAPRPARLIQDKQAARWFYAFLAQVYDKIVNPGHWTVDMRTAALAPAQLAPHHKVVDVGAGTGFCTQGVVAAGVPTAQITMVDQSPHQLSKARKKADLRGVTILEGDAENVPLPTDTFDRYVSAGSIEYWPNPGQGVAEAYRLLKPGGRACLIGPVRPTHWLSRAMADAWMLFPEEQEYLDWFKAAGFEDVQLHRIGPKWYRGVRRHGLIMGCSVVGTKKSAGASPAAGKQAPAPAATPKRNPIATLARVIAGSAAGFWYFVLPVYFWLKNLVWPRSGPLADKF